MKFEVAANITYEASAPTTLFLNVQPYKFEGQLVSSEHFSINPECTVGELLSDSGEKRFKVIQIPQAGQVSMQYRATVINEIKTIPGAHLGNVPVAQMPVVALSYLNPSRYCPSDRLYKFAFNKFGKFNHAFEQVLAICNWIHANVEYKSGFTTPQTSAYETITEQIGVCRDFAHLGIALCRALSIPARYLTCYSYKLQPPDFHACFEAYLGGYWVIFDATKLAPINGLVKIATGLDAAETAFASIFGNLDMTNMAVNSQVLSPDFKGLDYSEENQGYAFVL